MEAAANESAAPRKPRTVAEEFLEEGSYGLTILRRPFERLVIGDTVVITFVRIDANSAILAVCCPKHIPVHRQEIYRRYLSDIETGAAPELPEEESPPPGRTWAEHYLAMNPGRGLQLGRTKGRALVIGHDVIVTVADIIYHNGRCKVGVCAPNDVSIWREELYGKILAERRAGTRVNRATAAAAV